MKRNLLAAAVLALLFGRPDALFAGQRWAGLESEPGEDVVCIFIPAFDGPQPLGQQIATVLNLQIWQTLRKSAGSGEDFGTGLVVWDPNPLPEPSFAAAERSADEHGCQLAFWGRAWTYGDDVVAQTYLSILDRPAPAGTEDLEDGAGEVAAGAARRPHVLWRTEVEREGAPLRFDLGFPRQRYEFGPIVLKAEVVEKFSLPSALELTVSRDGGEQLGALGAEFRALEQHGDAARVESGGVRGWVRLPQLSTTRSEVVDFAGGIARLLRRDAYGAVQLLERVADNPATPAALEIDSLILQGVALESLYVDGWPLIERAYDLNPHSRITARYRLMKQISNLARFRNDKRRRAALEHALADTRHLFAGDEPWVVGARSLLSTP